MGLNNAVKGRPEAERMFPLRLDVGQEQDCIIRDWLLAMRAKDRNDTVKNILFRHITNQQAVVATIPTTPTTTAVSQQKAPVEPIFNEDIGGIEV